MLVGFFSFFQTFQWSSSHGIVGYALCFYTYSTWQGKTLFLEDFYVQPMHRNQGIGTLIFTEIATFAKDANCNRLELHVLNWNRAQHFYARMGGINLTEKEGWHYTRFDRKTIEAIANAKKWKTNRNSI